VLQGTVEENFHGDRAAEQRERLRTAGKDADRIKPIETMLSHSLGKFEITKASVLYRTQTTEPLEFRFSFVSPAYAKAAGDMLLVRPRVMGVKSSGLLETKDPRRFPVEFEGLSQDHDTFEITLPPGYVVEDLPAPIDVEYSFASYHSKSEVSGNVLRYSRTFEIKEVSVPLSKVEDLKKMYRIIASDERNNAVLRPAR
jgi:hypothetical protein